MPGPYNNNRNFRPHNNGWKVLETKVRGDAAVQVSTLPLRIPRYSFKVGSAQFDKATGEVHLGPFVTIHNYADAASLLKDVGDKYAQIREDKIDEVEKMKEEWQREHSTSDLPPGPEE